MCRALGMCAAIASMAACGVSDTYGLPTAGFAVAGASGAGTGGNGGATGSGGNIGGNTGAAVGSNGGNVAGTTTNGPPGTSGGIGNGPGGAAATGTGGNGPGGATGNGTGSGGMNGTTGGTTTGGGGVCATELQPCSHSDAGPECCDPLTCSTEPSAGGSFCEQGCSNDSQCTNAQTICDDGTCALNICGGNSGNGDYNGACASGSDQGTCVPKGTGKDEYGICYAAGSADGGCSDSAPTTDPTQLCLAGEACLPNPDGPGELCRTICDPGFGGRGMKVCADAGYSGGCFAIGGLGVCFNF